MISEFNLGKRTSAARDDEEDTIKDFFDHEGGDLEGNPMEDVEEVKENSFTQPGPLKRQKVEHQASDATSFQSGGSMVIIQYVAHTDHIVLDALKAIESNGEATLVNAGTVQ